MSRFKPEKQALSLACLALVALPALAADYDVSVHAGNTYTDNALLVPVGEESDNIGAAAMKADVFGQGEHYDMLLRTAVTYLHYFRGTLDDEVLRGFDGELSYTIVPERFLWTFQENYGPVLEDPLAADRPDNWTYDSYFTTGPDVQFGATDNFHVVTSARYARADYENTQVPSNQQVSGRVAIALPGTEHSENSLNLKGERVEQEDLPGVTNGKEGYDSQEAYVRISNTQKRTSFSVDLGGSSLHDGGESSSVPLVRVEFERGLSKYLSLQISGGSQYSDNLGRFGRLQSGDDDVEDPRDDVTPVTDPLEERFGDMTLEFESPRTTAAVRIRYNKLDYQNSNSVLAAQEYRSVTFDARRQVTPRFTLDIGGSFDRREYADIQRADDEFYGFIAAGWRIRREILLQVTGRYEKRDSSDPLANYTAKSVQLEFSYQLAQSTRTEKSRRRIGLY